LREGLLGGGNDAICEGLTVLGVHGADVESGQDRRKLASFDADCDSAKPARLKVRSQGSRHEKSLRRA